MELKLGKILHSLHAFSDKCPNPLKYAHLYKKLPVTHERKEMKTTFWQNEDNSIEENFQFFLFFLYNETYIEKLPNLLLLLFLFTMT